MPHDGCDMISNDIVDVNVGMGVPAIGSAAVEKAYTWIRGKLSAVNNGLGLEAPGPGLGLDPPFEVRLAKPMKTSRKSVAF